MGLFGFGKSKIDKRKRDWIVEGKNWLNKGNSLANLKKFEEAIACYDEVIKKNPKYPSVFRHKGMALQKLGRDKEAKHCFTQHEELQES